MDSDSLSDWLAYLERLHPREIDLKLDRVQRVLATLGLREPPFEVLAVGGTNGKGSCVAVLEQTLLCAGYRAGAYTSPHLVRYNERVRIAGDDATDSALLDALREVEAARGDEALTFFEFGTLAALAAFRRAGVDVAVLEVGMGGRLDAVNAVDALAAIVTSVDLDHQRWLGDTREAIGAEKAGIFRPGRPAVVGDPDPPASLLDAARARKSTLLRYGREFDFDYDGDGDGRDAWRYRGGDEALDALPPLATVGAAQYRNACCAIAALRAVRERLPVPEAALRAGLARARPRGRFELVAGAPSWLFDVAHNGASARELARNLAVLPAARAVRAVIGVLGDKSVAELATPLLAAVDVWYAVTTDGTRGVAADTVAGQLRAAGAAEVHTVGDVAQACAAADAAAGAEERIVVMGSFHVVGPALDWYSQHRAGAATERVVAEAGEGAAWTDS